jgi:hypothetical protein
MRWIRNKGERYYAEYTGSLGVGMGKGTTMYFGGIFNLDNESQVGTSLTFTEGRIPIAKLGFRRKVKSFLVNNSYSTNGNIKTMFTYM